MWNSESFSDRILDGWERSETSKGVPYYVNHKTERTQWEHPLLVKTLEELRDMDSVKYAAYRTAMKLRFIQKRLKLDLVSMSTVASVFERHGFGHGDTVVDVMELHNILVDIYCLARKDLTYRGTSEDMAEFTLSWLTNIYDVNRSGCIQVLAVKVGLVTLCSARLQEKYKYFFQQMSDKTNHASRKKLSAFIHHLMQLPEQIGESVAFGGLSVSPAVESCFKGAFNLNGVTEDVFISWLLKEPQTVVWLPTMHRMATAESVKHESKCSICKAFPIVGLRYRCLKCFNYDLCQDCFLTGRISKKHKLKHPTQEYCIATTSKEDTKAFMKTIRNNISKKHRNKKKLRYLPIDGTSQVYLDDMDDEKEDVQGTNIEDLLNQTSTRLAELGLSGSPDTANKRLQTENRISADHADHTDHAYNLGPAKKWQGLRGPEKRELESIIHHLEDENRLMLNQMEKLSRRSNFERRSESGSDSESEWIADERERMNAKQEILESHNMQLQMQLERLKLLLRKDQSPYRSPHREPLAPVSQNIPTLPKQLNCEKSPQYLSPYTPQYQQPYSPITPASRNYSLPYTPNTLTGLDLDTLDGSLDQLGQTHFSLPSPADQSCNFSDEEAELDDIMDKLDQGYPLNMTQHTVNFKDQSMIDEMATGAYKIGDAMTDVVGNVDNPEEQSIWDLADELLDREVMGSEMDDTSEPIHDRHLVAMTSAALDSTY